MTHDDVLFGFRLRLFSLAEELGNVSEACRQMGFLAPPTTSGSRSSAATASTACGCASAAAPGCRTTAAPVTKTAASSA
jgi:hypothetical protein